jgi:hypothetical protein
MPPFRDYLDRNHVKQDDHWNGKFVQTIADYFKNFFSERRRVTPALRAVAGTPHAATFNAACGLAVTAAKASHNLATTVLQVQMANTTLVTALDNALIAAEGQGALAMLVPPVPVSNPGGRTNLFNPNTSADFVRFGIWVIRSPRNVLTATEVGSQTEAITWDRDSGISKKSFTNATIGMVTGALETFAGRVARDERLAIEPAVDDKRHAEDSWFSAHLGALLALLPDIDAIVRLEVLVTVSMCERCRDHYMKYVRKLFGDLPIFIYTFRDDVMPQKVGPTQSALARKQTVWEVIGNGVIRYRGVWAAGGTTHDAHVYTY